MKEFDYIITGGGCSGLSLAYELEINNKLENKTLAIIEPRLDYKRDKTWSFWKVNPHNFEDCVKKSWKKFSIKTSTGLNYIKCDATPYQSIDSHLFYKKINNELSKNKNIKFFKNINDLNTKNSFIFNSVLPVTDNISKLWQHFYGLEIEVEENIPLLSSTKGAIVTPKPNFLPYSSSIFTEPLLFLPKQKSSPTTICLTPRPFMRTSFIN